jgi:mono/diheme cytochrome c family protein
METAMHTRPRFLVTAAAAVTGAVLLLMQPASSLASDQPSVERGRYVAKTAGCNDCHTAGYAPAAGKVPEAAWLMGDAVGWSGPWGTTYPSNLRIFMSKVSEEQWLVYARNVELRPPMPWFALRDLTESDLRSLYRFVRSLGPVGDPAPAYLPPGVEAPGPQYRFVVEPAAASKAVASLKD